MMKDNLSLTTEQEEIVLEIIDRVFENLLKSEIKEVQNGLSHIKGNSILTEAVLRGAKRLYSKVAYKSDNSIGDYLLEKAITELVLSSIIVCLCVKFSTKT